MVQQESHHQHICLKNLINCYQVTYDRKLDPTFVVHCSAFGLPDLLFEMHPCGLQVCYPKKMGEFGFGTIEDIKATEVIWGQSVLKMKGNTVRRNGMRVVQSIVKVPRELIKLQQDDELAIDCFFVNKHIFSTTYSTKICFTTVTHLAHHTKAYLWEALFGTYKMYLLCGFRIGVIVGDRDFASISESVGSCATVFPLNG
jgi:hypothetical protein